MSIYQEKICSKCKLSKLLGEFSKDSRRKDGKDCHCKSCKRLSSQKYLQTPGNRENRQIYSKYYYSLLGVEQHRWSKHIMRTYNLTAQEYQRMFEKQNGRCAGCLRHQSEFKNRLSVDHDHKTGKNRGLLCDDCNLSLGKAKDSVDILMRLAQYLNSSLVEDKQNWSPPSIMETQ